MTAWIKMVRQQERQVVDRVLVSEPQIKSAVPGDVRAALDGLTALVAAIASNAGEVLKGSQNLAALVEASSARDAERDVEIGRLSEEADKVREIMAVAGRARRELGDPRDYVPMKTPLPPAVDLDGRDDIPDFLTVPRRGAIRLAAAAAVEDALG
jgi:hypothetical protein